MDCVLVLMMKDKNQVIIFLTVVKKIKNIIKPYTKWIRTFSCTEGNERIPVLAKQLGLKTLVGAWLSIIS